jgi:LPS-assembly lipoprotein
MWWLEKTNRLTRLLAVLALGGLTAGCFQPLYGEQTVGGGGSAVKNKLAAVEVAPIAAPNGTPLARISVTVRNDLIFDLTGGSGGPSATHRLTINLSAIQQQVIVDINSGRRDIQNYGINATYSLIDIATGKTVMSGQTFSRVSYNIPGQEQRFAGSRGLRDAENRAAKVIASNIHSRLASYFVAGS